MERKDYKRYSREFKLEAVRLAGLGEKPKAQIARELGIRVNQLRKWRLDFELERSAQARPSRWQLRMTIFEDFGVRTPDCGRRSRF